MNIDESIQCRIAECLRDMQDERASRLEAATAIKEALQSQVNCMHETISHILHEDTTLAERICTLCREQRIMIPSILTVIEMAISTLVFTLTGSGGIAPSPPSLLSDKGGLRDWVKKYLESLRRALARLAVKAARALPVLLAHLLASYLPCQNSWMARREPVSCRTCHRWFVTSSGSGVDLTPTDALARAEQGLAPLHTR